MTRWKSWGVFDMATRDESTNMFNHNHEPAEPVAVAPQNNFASELLHTSLVPQDIADRETRTNNPYVRKPSAPADSTPPKQIIPVRDLEEARRFKEIGEKIGWESDSKRTEPPLTQYTHESALAAYGTTLKVIEKMQRDAAAPRTQGSDHRKWLMSWWVRTVSGLKMNGEFSECSACNSVSPHLLNDLLVDMLAEFEASFAAPAATDEEKGSRQQ
jgi:hypothetical protein